ncbi:hypothetical protein LTR99_009739 [Exophiala xenobiotica]|uniref:Uncharacterized protein n=1 Tax=Vermiconidia calcicola TaxID=1690605 RepID=A0AAV9PWM7_9PEZI|nr:hypothetical protein LTR96_007135 [Exophiala xenobiotica]KAK5294341.1 hypothetical protein LTR99_009739 [Exophiala xenobiotica]KAK5336234.1 hypothetical protein LTR98_007564 [Exophiala xenobiotica]KAK5426957.1 hypothetical protein LTR34_009462 [Exophiala xenobiotica]KAK5530577.1 hypothetical protein LTR25_009155 [Vermiconidia calcicola]
MGQNTRSAFLETPFEIRSRIYDLAIPPQYLKAQQFMDSDFPPRQGPPGLVASPRVIPSLFFVSKSIYQEAAAVFYSRATLLIAPIRPPDYIWNAHNALWNGYKLNTDLDLLSTFAHYPQQHLKRIQTCRIYSRQSDAINAEAYDSLLRWLANFTSVRTVYLSQRLMTRLRRWRSDLVAIHAIQSPRTQWERSQMSRLRKALKGRQLPDLQAYVLDQYSRSDALLDPRWDARGSDDDERLAMVDHVSTWIDSLLTLDAAGHARLPTQEGQKLYQICFIFDKPA